MNRVLEDIQPKNVFRFFEDICNIPHGSGNVEKISRYLVDFAKERGLDYRQDENFNVVIRKPATKGSTGAPVIIQGHMDMVAVKTPDKDKDMENEGLDLLVDGDYIKADRTSLGGDDGIAVAYALAILDDDSIKHPDIEAIFTVDEEVGMLGAEAMDCSDIKGRIMLNIDSEDEGIFLSSCAGGAVIISKYPAVNTEVTGTEVTINVSGVTSGHSGVDIIYQRANANVVLGRLLFELSKQYNYNIRTISGGEKDNSIAPRSEAVIVVEDGDTAGVVEMLNKYAQLIINEYSVTDKDMSIKVSQGSKVSVQAMDYSSTNKVVLALTHIQDGVVKLSNDIKGLVQTSINAGVVRMEDGKVVITYLLRSSVESEKEYLIDKVTSMVELLGGEYVITGKYPAWEYRSKLESKVKELLGDTTIDESRIATEVIIYADKICVDEETVRLRSHIEHARKCLNEDGGIGRKMDFIAQEMNREANTTLSKANDIEISNAAIDLKTEIEKVREQIQNIE